MPREVTVALAASLTAATLFCEGGEQGRKKAVNMKAMVSVVVAGGWLQDYRLLTAHITDAMPVTSHPSCTLHIKHLTSL